MKHSLSPRFQMLFFQQHHINAAYLPFGVAPDLLKQAMDGLWAVGAEGFNVTIPHKESVLSMTHADDNARLIGAANTIRRSDQGWQSTNTDWQGFRAVIDGMGMDLRAENVLLFGAGGTARAVLHALAGMGLNRVRVCNRNPDRLSGLLAFAARAYPNLPCESVAWEQEAVSRACRNSILLLNATSIGLQSGHAFPFSLCGDGAAIDAVYRADGNTAFTAAAGMAGRLCADGLPMLVAQGAASFAWWRGCQAPDCRQALTWMEQSLNRTPAPMPGWERNV